jgi:hypothetical protein
MAYLESLLPLWILVFIQITGLASALVARLSEGSRTQVPCHRVFLGLLGLMGVITMVGVVVGPRYWIASGLTLSVMILGAIWDVRAHVQGDSLASEL